MCKPNLQRTRERLQRTTEPCNVKLANFKCAGVSVNNYSDAVTCTKCLLEVLPTDLSLNPTIDVSHERNNSIHSASSEKHPLCTMSNMRQTHHNHDLLVHLNINIQNKFDALKESNKKLEVILSSRLIII